MLVPGIHSDSKIKLQEEVCTRKKKQQSLSDWQMFGIPSCDEFRVCSWSFSLFCFDFRRDSGELPGITFSFFLNSLALRRSSPTPLNTLCYWRRPHWTQKGEVKVASEGSTRPYPPSYVEQYMTWAGWIKYSMCPCPVLVLQNKQTKKEKQSARTTQKRTQTHTGVGMVRFHLLSLPLPLISHSKQLTKIVTVDIRQTQKHI